MASTNKKTFITISGVIVLTIMLLSYRGGICEYNKEVNITYNVTVPVSICDIGPTINCYPSSYTKEIIELKNMTFNESCKVVK